MFCPFLPSGFLLLTWGIAWLSLGHQPQPNVDDPKYINDTVSLLHYVTIVFLFIGMVLFAAAGIAGVIVHSVVTMAQEDDLVVTMKLAMTGLVCWVLSIGLLLWDPLNMIAWLFD